MKFSIVATLFLGALTLHADIEVGSLAELAEATGRDGQTIRLKPGVYRMADYLTEPVLARICADRAATKDGRPPVPMFVFRGKKNRIDCAGAIIEIDTSLYKKL
ncbi:MAG TPA: hypothetical protein PLS03_06945, partial [Terrimicrobiaceae bacterium]|nr:hypothetical protein [Terrimicrobiaceae bacterium]